MKITDVIYDKEDEVDYLEYITGRAYIDLHDGSKAVVRFQRDKKFDHYTDEYSMEIEQPKIPFFISFTYGKKRQWYYRVHRLLKRTVYNHIENEVMAKMDKQMGYKDKVKIPPRPKAGKPIIKNGI